MTEIPLVVAETEPFLKRAAAIWADDEKKEFVDFIAVNPLAGAEIQGTGGLRKVRWTRAGMGKRGGARVIYYYYDNDAPLFLFAVYTKAEKDDLSAAEKKILRQLVDVIKTNIRERRKAKKS